MYRDITIEGSTITSKPAPAIAPCSSVTYTFNLAEFRALASALITLVEGAAPTYDQDALETLSDAINTLEWPDDLARLEG